MGIEIMLDKDEYAAGDTITATVLLSLGKAVKTRGVFAELVCTEKRKVNITRHIPQSEIEERKKLGLYTEVPFTKEERVEEHVIHREVKRLGEEGGYQQKEFSVKFALPQNAQPTSREFGHDSKIHIWTLRVKLDVPFALDINAEREVFVSGL